MSPGLQLMLIAALASTACTATHTSTPAKNPALADRIERLVETFLTSDDDAKQAAALSEARDIFAREGIPGVATVGDAASYGFVLMNMLGQSPALRVRFVESVREAAMRHELPEDAVAFARARMRQTSIEEQHRDQKPSDPALRDQISRLLEDDQAVRQKEGFDAKKMEAIDRRTAAPLKAIFDRYGVPTYDMVGVQAAKDFIVMVQHQSPELRKVVLPKLKANVDAGQADPAVYAMVYDRAQRDLGKNQLYGEQLECATGKSLALAPIDDEANVNRRRAESGLMRVELYARLVRLGSPDMCASVQPR
jgi:Family of unknown function (DUF6624)